MHMDFTPVIPIGSHFAIIPDIHMRACLGLASMPQFGHSDPNFSISHLNYVGGQIHGRYIEHQMPFIGFNHVLQAEAFRSVLHAGVSESARLRCARLLADAVGMDGMCGGQYLDMIGEGKTLSADELDDINLRKTGALLAASCAMGTAAADGSREQEKAALQFGRLIGLAFQIRDDMLDVLSTSDELGKPVGSDREENKNTYMALLGPDACSREIRRLTDEAVALLRGAFRDTAFLEAFAEKLAERKN
jgi:geranylgeranyl diphosphate synthase type II